MFMNRQKLDDVSVPRVMFDSGIRWEAHHDVPAEGCSSIDGRMYLPGVSFELDIVTATHDNMWHETIELADRQWKLGTVLVRSHPVTTLVVPKDSLTAPVILEAIRRLYT